MQRPGGNWSVKCVLWRVLARASGLGWAERALVIAGTWRRWSGRRSPRPTTQSPVESVAAWDPDMQGIVLIAAMRIPLDSRGGSRRKTGTAPGTHWRASGIGTRPGPRTHKSKRTPCSWIYPAAREASRLSPSGQRGTVCCLSRLARESRTGLLGTSGPSLPGPTLRSTARGRAAWPRWSSGQRPRRGTAGGQ